MITERFSTKYSMNEELLYKAISIESTYPSAGISVLNRLERLLGGVKDTVADKILTLKTLKSFSYPSKDMGKFLKVNPYDSIMELSIYKPSGMTVSYLEALKVIETHHEKVVDVEKRLIDPFIKWSSEMLTDPARMSELSSSGSLDSIDVDGITEALDSLFDPMDKSDTSSYSDMIKRNSEWREVTKLIRVVINRQNRLKAARLSAKVTKASEAVNKIISYCRSEPNVYSCSEAARGKMADVVYNMGREVSLISRLYYIIKSLSTAIEDSAKKLAEL